MQISFNIFKPFIYLFPQVGGGVDGAERENWKESVAIHLINLYPSLLLGTDLLVGFITMEIMLPASMNLTF